MFYDFRCFPWVSDVQLRLNMIARSPALAPHLDVWVAGSAGLGLGEFEPEVNAYFRQGPDGTFSCTRVAPGEANFSRAKVVQSSEKAQKLSEHDIEAAPRVTLARVPAGRGPCSLTQGHVEDHILQWLQADPYWEKLGQRAQDKSCEDGQKLSMGASELEFKHEEGGYVGRSPPGCKFCNNMDMSTPFPATRVSAWTRCFLRHNRNWLVQLTEDVRNALRQQSNEDLRSNGAHFFSTCFSDTALTYGVLQVMKPSERYDPPHFDGGASLLHGGLTIFGSRHLECKVAASAAGVEEWQVLPQRPGSFYVGNLCAPYHRVRHFEQPGPLCAAAGDVHVTVMLRTDVFRAERSRATKFKPKPEEVFDIVNGIVASALSEQPLVFPDFASCLGEHLRLAC